jgi:hypothetical protein
MTDRRVAGLLTLAMLVGAQFVVRGPRAIGTFLVTVPAVIAGVWVIYAVRDRFLSRRADGPSFSASLDMDGLENSRHGPGAMGHSGGLAKTLGGGALGGFLDVTDTGLRWRPGPVSRLWRFRPFLIEWSEIEAIKSSPAYPGLGRLAADLTVILKDGATLDFETRNLKRLRQAIRSRQELAETRTGGDQQ